MLGQFNVIAKNFCDYYKKTFSYNIIAVEDERSMHFEDYEFDIEWRRVQTGDYSAIELTYKNGKIIREKS